MHLFLCLAPLSILSAYSLTFGRQASGLDLPAVDFRLSMTRIHPQLAFYLVQLDALNDQIECVVPQRAHRISKVGRRSLKSERIGPAISLEKTLNDVRKGCSGTELKAEGYAGR
jgi:hypothetical protein